MKAYEYITAKQIQWVKNLGIRLIGSKVDRGRPAYTVDLDENLFLSLMPDVRRQFEMGDGNELSGSPAKMQAVHSSSALGLNVFRYWQAIGQPDVIASACGFCRKGSSVSEGIVFEDKYPVCDDIDRFPKSPNIDVVFHNSESSSFKRFAVECKYSEAYGSRKHTGLKDAYLQLLPSWADLPHLFEFAKSICPDERFTHLHSAQLIKHILGLKNSFGKNGFKLLYLWYDVLGREGADHRNEIECFSKIAQADGIHFDSLSYQELIVRLSSEYWEEHSTYIRYLSTRYL